MRWLAKIHLNDKAHEVLAILVEPSRVSGFECELLQKRHPDLRDDSAAALVHVVFQFRT